MPVGATVRVFSLVPPAGFVCKTDEQQKQFVVSSDSTQFCLGLEHVDELIDILVKLALDQLFALEGDSWGGVVPVAPTVRWRGGGIQVLGQFVVIIGINGGNM